MNTTIFQVVLNILWDTIIKIQIKDKTYEMQISAYKFHFFSC